MQDGGRREAGRPLFEFLAATRPGRPEHGRARAVVTAIGIHALVLSLAVWASAATGPAPDPTMEAEHDYTIDLLSPTLLKRARIHSDGRAVAARAEARSRARVPARASARERERAARAADLALLRRLQTPPPVVPPVIPPAPPAVLASLERSEYGGLETDSSLTAGQIVADHHDPTADELASAPPRLVPYTEPPKLTNADEVRARLSREYPEYLQDQGIGGRVVLWFLVDENGNVRKYLVKQSSGHAALDRAALKVAKLMRFRPAVNYDRHVAVWVALPVLFQTVDAEG